MRNYMYLYVVLIGATMCGNPQQNDSDHEHGHEHDQKLEFTLYGKSVELFAKSTPFWVDGESELILYLSKLTNFQPIEGGKVTVTLTVGDNVIQQTSDTPVQAGIYEFTLFPKVQGKGVLKFDLQHEEYRDSSLTVNIEVFEDSEDAYHAIETLDIQELNTIVFPKVQSWKVELATELCRIEPAGEIIRTVAQVQPSQTDRHVITTKGDGILYFAKENMIDGTPVKQGEPLFFIESKDMAENNMALRYSAALNEYTRTKAEYERKSKLAVDKIVSATDLLGTKTEYDNAAIVYNNLKRNFGTGKQILYSPSDGFVTRLSVRNEEYIRLGVPIAVITRNKNLYLKAELKPYYFNILNNIVTANIKIPNSKKVYSLEELKGKIVSFGKSVDVENPLLPIIFQIENTIDLLSGSFVEIFLKTGTNRMAITIPHSAIIEEFGNYFVFSQLSPELFEKIPVTLGVTDGLRTEVTSGLSGAERIVSKAAMSVKLAQSSGALDPHMGHSH